MPDDRWKAQPFLYMYVIFYALIDSEIIYIVASMIRKHRDRKWLFFVLYFISFCIFVQTVVSCNYCEWHVFLGCCKNQCDAESESDKIMFWFYNIYVILKLIYTFVILSFWCVCIGEENIRNEKYKYIFSMKLIVMSKLEPLPPSNIYSSCRSTWNKSCYRNICGQLSKYRNKETVPARSHLKNIICCMSQNKYL